MPGHSGHLLQELRRHRDPHDVAGVHHHHHVAGHDVQHHDHDAARDDDHQHHRARDDVHHRQHHARDHDARPNDDGSGDHDHDGRSVVASHDPGVDDVHDDPDLRRPAPGQAAPPTVPPSTGAPTVTPVSATLPETGASSFNSLLLGTTVLGLGMLLIGLSRRSA